MSGSPLVFSVTVNALLKHPQGLRSSLLVKLPLSSVTHFDCQLEWPRMHLHEAPMLCILPLKFTRAYAKKTMH